jgi:hypothetical protein
MNSRRLIASPRGSRQNAAFNSGHQNRKLRPAKWGSNVKLRCGIFELPMAATGHSPPSHSRSAGRLGPELSKMRVYSISASASESRLSEILMPSDLAALMLISSSNLADCTTGSSSGLAPYRRLWRTRRCRGRGNDERLRCRARDGFRPSARFSVLKAHGSKEVCSYDAESHNARVEVVRARGAAGGSSSECRHQPPTVRRKAKEERWRLASRSL